jgi:hypothetical protein
MPKQEERGFSYQKRSKEDLKERANMKGGVYATLFKPKFKEWTPKDGKNRIRILPPTWKGAKHYGFDIHVNYSIGADNQKFLSLSKHGLGADPIAEARQEAQKAGDKDFAKKLYPNNRILYWIIDRADEDEGPLLWAAPFTFDKSLSNLCIDEDTKDVMFIDGNDDPANGHDVRFYKEGQGLNTKYDAAKMKVLPKSNVHEDEDLENEWLDFVAKNPLPEVLNFYDYDHIAAAFGGAAGRDDDDDDDKPVTKRKPIRDSDDDPGTIKTRRRSGEAADDPDDEDAPPSRTRGPRRDPDDDELEAPPRSRQRAKPSNGADDEVPDEKPQRRAASRNSGSEDDDDAPAEKPSRRTRAVVEEAEDPPSTRRTKPSADEDEGSGSIRSRLARRRSQSSDDD